MGFIKRHRIVAVLSFMIIVLPGAIDAVWSLAERIQGVSIVMPEFSFVWLTVITAPIGLGLLVIIAIQDRRQQARGVDFPLDPDQSIQISVGSGIVRRLPPMSVTIESGNTPHSVAIMSIPKGLSAGKAFGITNWNQRFAFRLVFQARGVSRGVSRFTVGKTPDDKLGFPIRKTIGIQIDDHALKGIIHDGEEGTTVDLGVSIVPDKVYSLVIVRGKATVAWLLDDEREARISGGPSGDFEVDGSCIQFEVVNGDEGGNQYIRPQLLRFFAT